MGINQKQFFISLLPLLLITSCAAAQVKKSELPLWIDRGKAVMGLEREVKESHEITRKYFEIAESQKEKREIARDIHNYIKAIDEVKRIRPRENILYAIAGKGIKNEISLID